MKSLFLFLFLSLSLLPLSAQMDDYKVACVAFYNLENLFDTENDTLINDEEFLPDGKRSWTKERYAEKVDNMAFVISKLGTDVTPFGASILGVSEIENRKVLEDLVAHDLLKERNYKIVHFDSPDKRGIDVALLYQEKHFELTHAEPITLNLTKLGSTRPTRDILFVEGLLDNEKMYFMVNHWPSRGGGEKKTKAYRNQGARVVKSVIDSLTKIDENAKIFVLGDLNDDPTSESVKSILRAKSKKSEVGDGEIFNPMADLYRRGVGSNAYRDAWSLFDQILLTSGLLSKKQDGYFHYKTIVYNKKFLIQKSGKYSGYPFRTFSGSEYIGGYSDHFPVFVYLAKKV